MAMLALGTAQFGLDYGLTNACGRLSEHEVAHICYTALDLGVVWLDTAAAYGSAEERVGNLLAGDTGFHISSKLMPTPKGAPVLEHSQRSFEASLARLRRTHIDVLLVHALADLMGPEGDALWRWMENLRESGLARSIGVSVYSSADIDAVLSRYTPDWLQLPCSVVDQRLVASYTLGMLKSRNIKIQARSLLLQGALTLQPEDLPEPLAALKEPITRMRDASAQRGIQVVDFALAWAAAQQDIDLGVVGVTSADELRQCADAFKLGVSVNWSRFACSDEAVVDPRTWPPGLRV